MTILEYLCRRAVVLADVTSDGLVSVALSYLTSTLPGTVIIVYIKVVGNRGIPFALSGVELRLPWKNTPASLLQDPADSNTPAIYKFSRYNTSQYDRSEAIFQTGKTPVVDSYWRDISWQSTPNQFLVKFVTALTLPRS